MQKVTNSSVWKRLWFTKRGWASGLGYDRLPVFQESYTEYDQSVCVSHSSFVNNMQNSYSQAGNCLKKRASDNFSRDLSHQTAEPYLTPSTWNNVDMLKKPFPNTLDSSSQPSTSKSKITDPFWTSNNNAMIAFFVILGVFVFALGLWIGYLVFKWYRRKQNGRIDDIEQQVDEVSQPPSSITNMAQAEQFNIKINQEMVESICPSSRIEDIDGLTIVNRDSFCSTDEKSIGGEEGASHTYHEAKGALGVAPSEERLAHYHANMSETTLEWKEMCAICLEEYLPQDFYRKLPCGHTFHTDCVDTWFANTRKVEQIACPTCKADYSETFEARIDPPKTVQSDTNSILNVSIAPSTIRFRRFRTWLKLIPPESEDDALRRQTRRQMRARRLMAYRIQQAELAADGGYVAAMYSPYPTFVITPYI